MKSFEESEKKASKKWLFVIPNEFCFGDARDILADLVKRAKLRKIYYAVDFNKNHSHCYFEFSVPRTLEYMTSFSFGTNFEIVSGSPSYVYSYLEDGISQGVIYSFFSNGKIVENEIKNDFLIDVSNKTDFSQYNVCIFFDDGSFKNYFFETKSDLDNLLKVLKDIGIKYCVYQKK